MASTKIYWLMAIGMALQVVHAAPSTLGNNDVCTSSHCVQTAASIIRDMNPAIDPCDDFSAYTCGGFWEREEIPADKESIGYFSIVADQNNRVIRSIVSPDSDPQLEAIDDKIAAGRNLQKLKDLYASCMDEEQIAKIGRQPVVDQLKTILDLFPATAANTTLDRKALSMTLAHLNRIGLDSFSSFGVSTDAKDPTRHLMDLSEGGLGLPSKEYYLDERITTVYQTTVAQMFELMQGKGLETNNGTSLSKTKVEVMVSSEWEEAAKDVVAFEKLLADIATERTEQRDPEKSYNPRTLDQIRAMTPSIDWHLIVQSVLPEKTDILDIIIVNSPGFQKRLEGLLQKTSSKTIQNYFSWIVIRMFAGSLALPYRQPLRNLNAALSGVSADVVPDRWKICVAVVNSQLGDMAGQYFISDSFKGNSRAQVHDMIESLRETYLKSFPNLNWLDDATTEGAIMKMKAIVQLTGFSTNSPNVGSSNNVDLYYKDYKVDRNDYFGNQLRMHVWNTERYFNELGKLVNKKKMYMSPQTVNAYYSPTENQIVFPAGILQPPFFHTENPEYVNWGGIGVVAGHEITHGFDNKGHQFDSMGRLTNWWSNSTTEAFNKKAQCFIDQYGNFTVKGPDEKDYNVNGLLTLGENIADNGGLKQSFDTWRNRYNSDPAGHRYSNFRLPGLEGLTAEQLFFISYARPWCSKQRPESAIRQMRMDPHSPAKWRINGAVQNSVGFAEAFKCKAKAPMNPKEKCDLW
ncbi:hypothetical protein BGZ47_008458 [Haplosporangium gracile]|nr:hypothetical protein BGZ47_008458 [Haplosporangium gracile]